MKLSMRDAFVFIAIIAMAIAFWLHRREVKNDFHQLQLNTEHSIAQLEFEYAIKVVDENFRQAGLGLLPNKTDFAASTYTGTFEYEYNWWNNNDSPVKNGVFVDLIRPVSERFNGLDGRFIWDSETTPSLRSLFSKKDLESGTIKFTVTYQIPKRERQ